jgi:hypothetical protein
MANEPGRQERIMRPWQAFAFLAGTVALAACNQQPAANQAQAPKIKVRGAEQDQLHKLTAMNLAIALKRAIYDAGYTCSRVTDAGFVAPYENLDMWEARCTDGKATRDWAVFTGPDGSAQVRDCKDIPGTGLPVCEIKRRPKDAGAPAKS